MPDPSGPGWALGANRPPAGRMTRAGRLGPSPASRAVAGRTVAGGLSSGTVALGGHDVRPSTGPRTGRGRSQAWSRSACPSLRGRAVRLQDPVVHTCRSEGRGPGWLTPGANSPQVFGGAGVSLGGGVHSGTWGAAQPPGHRLAHRRSHAAPGRPATSKHHRCRPGVACDFAGPGVLIGVGPWRSRARPGIRSPTSVGPRQRHFRIPPDPWQRRPPGFGIVGDKSLFFPVPWHRPRIGNHVAAVKQTR
jgi:hypothetical protein